MSSNSLARLSIELAANTAAFQGDMGKAARIAEKEMGAIKQSARDMGLVMGGAIAAGAGAFAALAKQSIDAADDLNDMKSVVGMTVEQMSAYSYMAKMNGADNAALTTGLQKLNSNVIDAARGQGAAKDAFAALGISVRGANGEIKSQDQIMREVADKFAGFEDGAVKSALAVDIFGKSGADLIPMLNSGAAGMDAMRAEAEAMGQVMSDETAAGAAAVNDNIDQMKLMMGGAVNQVTAGMLPTFASLTEVMKRTAQDTDMMRSIADGLAVAFKALVTVAMTVKAAFSLVGDSIGKVMAAIAAAARGDFQAAKDILFDTSASQSLSDSLTNIRDLWVGVTAEANQAGTAQQKAMGAAPQYAAAGGKAGAKGKKPKAVDWDKEIMDTVTDAAREQGSAQQVFEREKAAAQSAVQSIQQSLMTKRQLLDQDMLQQRMAIRQAADMEVISETQKNLMLEQLEVQHKAKIKALDDEELAHKRSAMQQTVGFFNNGLNIIANSQSKHAKAAQAIVKAQQLFKIGVDTRAAAMGAYAALAGIPIVGPALGVAAAGAAIAFGAVQASAIGGSIGGSATPSTPATPSAASSIEPAYARDDLTKKQTTVLQFPANKAMTGRDFVEWIDEALGDGAQLTNLRFMAV